MQQTGRVLKSTGIWYQVQLPDGEILTCRLKGKIRLSGLRTTNPIAVGDEVILSDERDEEGNAIIVDFVQRKNYIVRKSTNLSKQMQILAANIDRVYLMVTLHSPETHPAFIDRFLVAAESFRIPCTLLFNKMDQYNEDDHALVDYYIHVYQSIGYPCHKLSLVNDSDFDFLREEIKGQQVMIGGHSGVGKSSLVNALDPQIDTRVGEISKAHHSGQHTTTFAEMFPLSNGGAIIDTPGIRAFGMIELEKDYISHYFPEMRERMHLCRFSNCKHLNEPHCAIKDAVEEGEINDQRYANYWQMMHDDEKETYRKNDRV